MWCIFFAINRQYLERSETARASESSEKKVYNSDSVNYDARTLNVEVSKKSIKTDWNWELILQAIESNDQFLVNTDKNPIASAVFLCVVALWRTFNALQRTSNNFYVIAKVEKQIEEGKMLYCLGRKYVYPWDLCLIALRPPISPQAQAKQHEGDPNVTNYVVTSVDRHRMSARAFHSLVNLAIVSLFFFLM